MAANLVQGIDRIAGQLGYLVVSSDGSVLASAGDLENEENIANIVVRMLQYAAKVPLSADDSQSFKRLSVVYDDFTLLATATVDNETLHFHGNINDSLGMLVRDILSDVSLRSQFKKKFKKSVKTYHSDFLIPELVKEDNRSTSSQESQDWNMPRNGPYTSNQYLSHSKLQSPLTIKWLNEHYEVSPGVSLPRSSLYTHYLDFCQKSGLNPVNAASFGKIIRHNFPKLKTRRLGTRGQSKYHYYGITIKETSPYHDTLFNNGRQNTPNHTSAKATESLTRNQTISSGKNSNANQHCLMSSSGGTLLPLFPKSETLNLPPNISKDKVKTFLIMYRAHCQRILDTILRANFGEVQKFLVHFWQGMPEHILTILSSPEVIDLVGVCDGILFKAIGSVLIPGVLQPLPASLTQAIRQFATQLSSWLESSLTNFPEKLREKKLEVANVFSKSLRRKTSLTHLAQAARTVLHSTEPVTQMINDWQDIDFKEIVKQTLWTFSSDPEADCKLIETFLHDFTQLLEQQATIDQYAEWASNLVDTCIKKYFESNNDEEKTRDGCRQFLLKWSFFSTQVMRELTLKSAQSFGSFHLLHILLEDYIVYCVECKASAQAQDDVESKIPPSEEYEPPIAATEVMEVEEEETCDIDEADESPTMHHNSESRAQCEDNSGCSGRAAHTGVFPGATGSDTPSHAPVAVPSAGYNNVLNIPSNSDNSATTSNANVTEGRSFPYYAPNSSESSIHSFLPAKGFNGAPTTAYGLIRSPNVVYGGVYSPVNGVRSPAELKAYTQYAVPHSSSYSGRYFSPSAVTGAPVYSRNFFPVNSGHSDEQQLGLHPGYDHRFHSRVIGEGAVPQPTMLGAL